MRKLVSGLIFLLLIAGSAPWIMGYFIAATIQSSIDNINQSGSAQVTLQNYQRGWLSSVAAADVTILATDQTMPPIRFRISAHIWHGPLLQNRLFPAKFWQFGQAFIAADINSFSADTHFNLSLQLQSYLDLVGNSQLMVDFLRLQYQQAFNLRHAILQAHLNAANVIGSLQVEKLAIHQADKNVAVHDAVINWNTNTQDGLLTLRQDASIGLLSLQHDHYANLTVALQADKLHWPTLLGLLTGQIPFPTAANNMMQRLSLLADMNQLFGNGATLSLSCKQQSKQWIQASLRYPNVNEQPAHAIQAQINLAMPINLTQDLAALVEEKLYINQLINAGILHYNRDTYTASWKM